MRDAEHSEGIGCGSPLNFLEPGEDIEQALVEGLADLFIHEADYLAHRLVELAVDEVHLSLKARRQPFDLLHRLVNRARIQRQILLSFPDHAVELLQLLLADFGCSQSECLLDLIPHPLLALMNQLGKQLCLYLHFLRENRARSVLLELLPQFLEIFGCGIGILLLFSPAAEPSLVLLLVILE